MSEVKRHYIADESLGGIEREYVEVGRKASVGDYVHVTKFADEQADVIVKIDRVDDYGDFIAYPVDKRIYDRLDLDKWDKYKTLSPTNIIRHHGQRYEMVDRKAGVGEEIIHVYEGESDGIVTEVTDVGVSKVDVEEYVDGDGDMVCAIDHGAYRVLVPIEGNAPQSTDDIIANLIRRVAVLETQLRDVSHKVHNNRLDIEELHETTRLNTDNIRTWAEDYTEFKTKKITVSPPHFTVTNGLDVEELAQKLAEKILIGGRSL